MTAATLTNAWGNTLDAVHEHREISFFSDGLLMAFDKAYVDFEKAYIDFLMRVESSCKSILLEANFLVSRALEVVLKGRCGEGRPSSRVLCVLCFWNTFFSAIY